MAKRRAEEELTQREQEGHVWKSWEHESSREDRYRQKLVELSTTKKEASLAKKAGNKDEQRDLEGRIRELTTETASCIGRNGLTEAAAMRVKGELDEGREGGETGTMAVI